MRNLKKLQETDVQQIPWVRDLFEKARSGSESFLTYEGITVSVMPVEDITHTFTSDELAEFLKDYAAADDLDSQLTVEQALERFRKQLGHDE